MCNAAHVLHLTHAVRVIMERRVAPRLNSPALDAHSLLTGTEARVAARRAPPADARARILTVEPRSTTAAEVVDAPRSLATISRNAVGAGVPTSFQPGRTLRRSTAADVPSLPVPVAPTRSRHPTAAKTMGVATKQRPR